MGFLEICWFLIGLLITSIVILVDPKNPVIGSGNGSVLSGLASPSSRQNFILKFNNILVACFFVLTVILGIVP